MAAYVPLVQVFSVFIPLDCTTFGIKTLFDLVTGLDDYDAGNGSWLRDDGGFKRCVSCVERHCKYLNHVDFNDHYGNTRE